MKTRKKEKIWK